MATTLGGFLYFVSDDLIVVQDIINNLGKTVDSLMIEFDLAAY